MKKEREHGGIQPGIKWGPFTMRIPGVHVGLYPSQHLQGGLLLLAAGGATAPLLMQYFDVSFEIAWTVMLVLFFWVIAQNVLFGDVYAGGAITAALPLTIVYLNGYSVGTESIQAMIAVTIVVTLLFLFFGVTKLGEKFNNTVPAPLKAGIIMGAAIAAFQSEINRVEQMPITLVTAWIIVMVLMYSIPFAKLPNTKTKVFIGANALVLTFVIAGIVGFIVGEISFSLEWGIFIPPFAETLGALAPWSVGLPSWSMIVAAIPLGVMIYILAFGDILVADTLLKGATKKRPDEEVELNTTRSHYVLAIRNFVQLLTAGPLITLHGPIWTGAQVFLAERYKQGKEVMDSIHTGTINFYIAAIPLGILLPIITLIMPLLPVALSVTMLLTGFACAYVAMEMVKDNISRGLVIAIGMLTAMMGPAWGIGAGIVLYLLLIGKSSNKDESFSEESANTESEHKVG
ncbi:hypothetical protein [Bacillus sp. FJAT-45350]|uniref:hypothetical protein n=1 Tax=Bacillus sp. FJAT-45350 TaxID=2011014 RepID=UPI0015C9CC97|nr:hypothetical protein [Bacillus sp. FJAT-45350]